MSQYPNLGKRAARRAMREAGMIHEGETLEVVMKERLGLKYREELPEAVISFAKRVFLSHKSTFGHFPTKDEWGTILIKINE
jgi:hypothetical protein